ncbi:flippase-like domain-containing protein [Candidatus Woesearchaeota archaeon]|nr:flippase-like domain-containing protein [Candidatus Woesearchaeota archaeon]
MRISKSLISLGVSVLVGVSLLWFVLYKYPFGEVVLAFHNVTWPLILAYLFVSFCIMLTFAVRWKMLLHAQGHDDIPFWDLFSYRVIDYGVSYVTPTGKLAGEPVRAAMCKRNGIGFREALSSITIDKTIELSFTLVMFAIGCFFLIISRALSVGISLIVALLCAFLLFLIWKFYKRILKAEPIFSALFRFFRLDRISFLARFETAVEEFEKPILRFYREERQAYFWALGLSVVAFTLSMIEYNLVLRMVGIAPTIAQTFMVFAVVGIAFVIPVPMGLGSLEFAQAWLFSVLTFGSAAGIGLAMITRGRDLLWVLISLSYAFYYGSLKRAFEEAFQSKYSNPVVKMTVFRGGKPEYLDMKVFRQEDRSKRFKEQQWKKNYEEFLKKNNLFHDFFGKREK